MDKKRPAETSCHRNGVKRPRYFDRQVIGAVDLTLEQRYQDNRARRMARYLHGWGVVCGFEVNWDDNVVVVEPGYAISPLGDEILLNNRVMIDDIRVLVQEAGCDCDDGDCEDIDPDRGGDPSGGESGEKAIRAPGRRGALAGRDLLEKNRETDDEEDDGTARTVVVYLVARPVAQPSDRMAAMPEGCGHPGNTAHYSRDCHAVCLEIVCKIEAPHLPEPPDCARLEALVCGTGDKRPALPMPADVADAKNYVVIAAFALRSGRLFAGTESVQRRLLPMEVLQDWLRCLCERTGETKKPAPAPDRETEAKPAEPRPVDPETGEKRPLVPPLREVTGIGARRQLALESDGIMNLADLAAAETVRVAKSLAVSEATAAGYIADARSLIADRDGGSG